MAVAYRTKEADSRKRRRRTAEAREKGRKGETRDEQKKEANGAMVVDDKKDAAGDVLMDDEKQEPQQSRANGAGQDDVAAQVAAWHEQAGNDFRVLNAEVIKRRVQPVRVAMIARHQRTTFLLALAS